MGNLEVDDILNLRLVCPLMKLSLYQVSRRHLALSRENELWEHLWQKRNPANNQETRSDTSDPLQEGHWETEYRRLVRRDRNWRLGLVSVHVLPLSSQLTFTGSTSHGLSGSQGPCDLAQACRHSTNKRIDRRHVSDYSDLRLTSVFESGMYPYCHLRPLSSHPPCCPQARSHVSITWLRKLSSLPDLAMSVVFNHGERSKTIGNPGSLLPVILMGLELSRESPSR
jgi:hypothetical protein